MPRTIGKYRIVEPIGRGGMGMIFKAHDPVLDRLVALKVIAPEVEVSDEMRARFFREAKACAKLNHPNIVTVHDMGEDAGRLFIVMELLQGEELRQLIKANAPLTLEDKLSVMRAVCRGLHYAHQQGVVHRDMKPANIFVLRTGQPKILDFGIAQLNTTDTGLTRTGLIMGTLRYMSPEQVRGRVDHRSDMFSVGSVLYELLTLRPPFLADDAIQLLEQLRVEDPPPLRDIDPAIPPALEALVLRALRKDPAQRFRDLDELGAALEAIHTGVDEGRQQAVNRVRQQRDRITQLQSALADRVGSSGDDTPFPSIEERHGLLAVLAAERDGAGRIAALETKIARADALAPVVESAQALLDAGRFEEAAQQFERVVRELPDHQRARESLDRTQVAGDGQRGPQRAREIATQARNQALALEVTQYAHEAWDAAEARLAEAQAAFAADDTGRAGSLFAEAASLYRRAEETARTGRERERRRAEAARERVTEARDRAEALDAEHLAAPTWNEAVATSDEAEAAWLRHQYARAAERFEAALVLYHRAQSEVRDPGRRPQRPAAVAAADEATASREPRERGADIGRGRRSQTLKIAAAAVGVLVLVVAGVGYWRHQASTSSRDQSVAAGTTGPATPATASPPPASPPVASQPAAPAAVAPPPPPLEPTPKGEPERPRRPPAVRDETTKAATQTPKSKSAPPSLERVAAATPPPAPAPPPLSAIEGKGAAPPFEASAIRKAIENKLQGAGLLRKPNSEDPGVAIEEIGPDGAVRLVGVLKDGSARQAAAELVRGVAGVTAVDVRRVTVQTGWSSK